MVTYCLFAEELARGSLSVAAAAAMQSLMGTYFVYKYGSEALRARYLTPALRGDLVATFALTSLVGAVAKAVGTDAVLRSFRAADHAGVPAGVGHGAGRGGDHRR